jgi:hypothetical protein
LCNAASVHLLAAGVMDFATADSEMAPTASAWV